MRYVIFGIIAVLAIVVAVIAFRLSDQGSQSTAVAQNVPASEVTVRTVDVLVARSNIPVGSIIDNSMIDKQPWPENLVLEGFIVSDGNDKENIVGKVVRSGIQAHEPFMKNKLANPNDPGFLAASLPTGMRAVTVATDAVSGVAGFVFPGDRVDVLFTHESIPGGTVSSGKPTYTEVLAPNLRVLGVNIRDGGDPSKPAAVSPSSVTLEVTDSVAQQIRLAEKNGTLSLSLRSIRDDAQNMIDPTSLANISRASALSTSMSIVRGPGAAGGKISYEDLGATGKSVGVGVSVVQPAGYGNLEAPEEPVTPVGMPTGGHGNPNINNNAGGGQNNVR